MKNVMTLRWKETLNHKVHPAVQCYMKEKN